MDFNHIIEEASENSPVTKKDIDLLEKRILDRIKQSENKILKEIDHNQRSIKRALTRILQETKETKQTTKTNHKSRSELLLKVPFDNLEQFQNFEKDIQEHSSKFNELKEEFFTVSGHTAEKFVKNAWRQIFIDGVAQNLCWKGTKDKMAVRPLSVTAALKSTFSSRFPHATDIDFERTSIVFFQHAKGRYMKKKAYDSKKNKNVKIKFNLKEHNVISF
ncbi:uncharacterized protein LOC126765261 [Bactrocera neohumeralis]|uniref:uncharacterized protein LOC120768075 n=1 Tax=Bactrocera tryoni TaxID=59916 RepID=UPI001A962866|nr:uncharacterized protein LOC120768075 [Bactrocera tryoni]XP_050338920.1 uncharacterized protein LOC126765261 [Bactrocera neohumeralis]